MRHLVIPSVFQLLAVIPRRKKSKPYKEHGNRNRDIYNTRRWRAFRKSFLYDNPWCAHCLEEGQYTEAKYCDHKTRINDGGAVWSRDNIQGLCVHHDAVKRGKEAHIKKGAATNL